MTRRLDIMKVLAMALVAVALLGIATPLCTMPDCDDLSAGTCSDFKPACDECPDSDVVMKHTHDDAIRVAAHEIDAPVALAASEVVPAPTIVLPAFAAPEVTASPPPLDPLGVRLTV
ncbi:MAG: hypothetical protein Q7W51_10250 [Coriobacteriia bacterium]|nr:hypothetical protein [Coriobacteriia bacterium]